MHVLSIVTALLFAVTSFAAVAPTHNSSTTVSHNTTHTVPAGSHKVNPFIHQSVDASQVDSAVSAQGDEPAQNLKNIVSDATGKLDLLSKQLFVDLQQSNLQSFAMTISQMSSMLTEASDSIETAVGRVEMTSSNISFLGPFVFDFLSLIATILFDLILAIRGILWNASYEIITLIKEFLTCIFKLLGFLESCTDGILILSIIFGLIKYLVKTLASFLGIEDYY